VIQEQSAAKGTMDNAIEHASEYQLYGLRFHAHDPIEEMAVAIVPGHLRGLHSPCLLPVCASRFP